MVRILVAPRHFAHFGCSVLVVAVLASLPLTTAAQISGDEGEDERSESASSTTQPPTEMDISENITRVMSIPAQTDRGALILSISGGVDKDLFEVLLEKGSYSLVFKSAPDYENPADNDRDNVYKVEVTYKLPDLTAKATFWVSVTDADEPPPTPKAPTVTFRSDSGLEVSWDPLTYTDRPAVTSYSVRYRQTMPGDWITIAPNPPTSTNMITYGLKLNTEYEVQVRASNDDGHGAWSSSATVTTKRPPVFATVGSKLSVEENTVLGGGLFASDPDGGSLTWSLTGGADRALFELSSLGNIYSLVFKQAPDYENPADSDKDNVYEVEVTVTDSDSLSVSRTFIVSVNNVSEPPPAPEALSAIFSGALELSVSWNAPTYNDRPPVISYSVRYRRRGTSTWVTRTPYPLTHTSMIISGLSVATGYEVQVRASNDEGHGVWSGSKFATTKRPPVFRLASDLGVRENAVRGGGGGGGGGGGVGD